MDQIGRILLIAGLMIPSAPAIAAPTFAPAPASAPASAPSAAPATEPGAECMGGDWSRAGDARRIAGCDPARAAGKRDWRDLWYRTPVHRYEQPPPPAPPPVAAAPDRSYDDDDDDDRDYLWLTFPRDHHKAKKFHKHRRGERFEERPVARGDRRDRPSRMKFREAHDFPESAQRR